MTEAVDWIARAGARAKALSPIQKSCIARVDNLLKSNGGAKLEQYPGSPAIANLLLRPIDPLHAYELHPTDERILRALRAAARQPAREGAGVGDSGGHHGEIGGIEPGHDPHAGMAGGGA
mgnify:CR=1 FL=1